MAQSRASARGGDPGRANVVALTGGIGSGKTTLARLLAQRGALLCQADLHARAVLAEDAEARRQVLERFGPKVAGKDGSIDRAALAAVVFSDPAALADLEAIVHPRVWASLVPEVLSAMAVSPLVVVELPLLAERGLPEPLPFPIDAIVVVEASPEVALTRLAERGLSAADASARIAAQASPERRRRLGGYVVRNDAGLDELARQVEPLWTWVRSPERRKERAWPPPR